MSERGDWRLAPAYDLTFAAGPGGEHYLDIEGEGRHPTKGHVRTLGLRHGLSDRLIEEIIEAVGDAVAAWPKFAEEMGVTAGSRKMITTAHEDVRSHF